MPDLVKIGRQVFPTKRFYFGQTPTEESQIQQEKNAFLRRLRAYYNIKIRYFGMKIDDMWQLHEQRTTYIYECSLACYRFMIKKIFPNTIKPTLNYQ